QPSAPTDPSTTIAIAIGATRLFRFLGAAHQSSSPGSISRDETSALPHDPSSQRGVFVATYRSNFFGVPARSLARYMRQPSGDTHEGTLMLPGCISSGTMRASPNGASLFARVATYVS